jgi:hypothetical protein
MNQKSLAVVLSKHLYMLQLICVSAIGIILSTYTCDNMFEILLGKTYALQLLPEAQILTEINSGTQPFLHNYVCLSLGLGVVLLISIALYTCCDCDNRKWFQPVKTLSLLLFLGSSLIFFGSRITEPDESHKGHSGWEDVPTYSMTFGYVVGIYAFSYTQPATIHNLLQESTSPHSRAFKLPLFISMMLVTETKAS